MSIFYCVNCDQQRDSDQSGCKFNPLDSSLESCVCDDCEEKIMEKINENQGYL